MQPTTPTVQHASNTLTLSVHSPLHRYVQCFYERADAGSGGAGGGTPAGGTPPAGAGGAAQPITLSNDSLIIPPGGGQPVKYGDYIGGYVPKATHDQWEQTRTAAERRLVDEAARLDRLRAESTRSGQQPPPDPFKDIEALELVDGATLANLARNGFGNIARHLQMQQQTIAGLQKQLGTVETGVRSFSNQRNEETFNKRIDSTVQALGLAPEIAALPESAILRELVQDVYGSYEPSTELDQKLPTLVADRLAKLRVIMREMDKADAKAAVQKARLPPTGGRITPTGTGAGRLENNSEIARRYFPQSA